MTTAWRLLTRLQITRGRLVLIAALVGAVGAVGLAAAVGGAGRGAASDLVQEAAFFVAIPLVALVFGAACLGDLYEDGTLVYLWLRPLPFAGLAAAATGATVAVAGPTAVAVVLAATVVPGQLDLALPATIAAVAATVAYSAVFVALGLRTVRSLLWGLGYVLLLEGFFGRLSPTLGALSVRRHATSLFAELADVPHAFEPESGWVATTWLAGVAVTGVGAATWWLARRDVP